jgi:Flp pilus assembly protein protease CpaA
MLAVACALAVWASCADASRRQIPNAACLALSLVGLAFQSFRWAGTGWPALLPWDAAVSCRLASPPACLACALVALVAGTALELWARRLRGAHGLGLGDVKYLAAWACVLGPAALVPFAFACLAGAAASLARGRRTFPFAPWLSGLALVALAALPFSPPA